MGPVLFEDDLVVVTHRPLSEGRLPGYLFVEPRRHTTGGFPDLTDAEGVAVGRAAARAARALRRELSPRYVFSKITGITWEHFHQHVFARDHDTPDDVPWHSPDLWADPPPFDHEALESLCDRLRERFTDPAPVSPPR